MSKLEKRSNSNSEYGTEESGRKRRSTRPRKPHPLEALLGETVINNDGDEISPRFFSHADGVIGLYFAAYWCPPCRSFSPNLMLLYDELKKRGEPFEVVYVSLDNKETSFYDYLTKMPWWAVSFGDEERREEIAINFEIQGIPKFVLLDAKTLEVITIKGREVVSRDPRGALFPWKNLSSEASTENSPPSTPPHQSVSKKGAAAAPSGSQTRRSVAGPRDERRDSTRRDSTRRDSTRRESTRRDSAPLNSSLSATGEAIQPKSGRAISKESAAATSSPQKPPRTSTR